MGLRDHEENSASNETDEGCDEEHDDLIDLTGDLDCKPIIKVDASPDQSICNSPPGKITFSPEMFYPSINMCSSGIESKGVDNNTEDEKRNRTEFNTWNKEYCSLAEYKEGEFRNNSVVLCADHDNDENSLATSTNREDGKLIDPRKRSRVVAEPGEPIELHTKIMQLLSNFNHRERSDSRIDQENSDEDRMFLLSLVSDLKRVPAARKMVVKAEIATAIAKAIQP